MASPQVENGYVPISQELLQAVARAKLKATTRSIFDCITSMTYGWHRKTAPITLEFFVDWTGCAKITVRRSLRELFDRKMIRVWNGRPANYAIQKDYERWIPEQQYRERRRASKEGIRELESAQRVITSEGAQRVITSGHSGTQNEHFSPVESAHLLSTKSAQRVVTHNSNTNTNPSTEISSKSNGNGIRETWLTDYNEIWKAAYGGNLPFKVAAKFLREAEKEIGRQRSLENFTEFCKTDVQFMGKPAAALAKFAATCGSWTARRQPTNPEALRILQLQKASQAV